MGRTFKIERDYHEVGVNIFKKKSIELNPGVTVLVGCNGIGKTTLLSQIKNSLKKENIPCIHYDNLKDGGSHSRSEAVFNQNFEFLASSMCSSEGENIVLNLGEVSKRIGSFFRKNSDKKEIWILLDAIDSGFSIDNILDLKEGLFNTILEYYNDKTIYIVVTANEYEMANGERCFDVLNGKYVQIKSYDRYKKLILKTRDEKDKLYGCQE